METGSRKHPCLGEEPSDLAVLPVVAGSEGPVAPRRTPLLDSPAGLGLPALVVLLDVAVTPDDLPVAVAD